MKEDTRSNVRYIIDANLIDLTKGSTIMMDTLVINSDIVRTLQTIYFVKPYWGDEYFCTVRNYFHPINLTLHVRKSLSIS